MDGIKEIRKHIVKAVVVYHTPFHLESMLGNLVSQVCDIFVSLLTHQLFKLTEVFRERKGQKEVFCVLTDAM